MSKQGRSDLANAAIAGLRKDLRLTGKQYSNLASIFLAGNTIFQMPGTLLLRNTRPQWQFGVAVVLVSLQTRNERQTTDKVCQWGLFTLLSVVTNTYSSLMALRFLIGVAEAFTQGAVFCRFSLLKFQES